MAGKGQRGFTQAARLAALEQRRRRQAQKALSPNVLEVFVTRSDNRFRWEIRTFGAVTVEASAEAFDNPQAARDAGSAALVVVDAHGRSLPAR